VYQISTHFEAFYNPELLKKRC